MWPLCVGFDWLVALGLTVHARTITLMLPRALKRGDARVELRARRPLWMA
ncbi:hypothetical protein AZ54_15690 [Xanthomonas oryzae pv. oryzae PXO86]|nr:hypothetical protein [Xanthomonas oryzae]AJQ85575.1 hypothetical protein AZ54_15690 [Xanthomonas oryzae pv. oryzae PXO86]